jgi:hypothetical protein
MRLSDCHFELPPELEVAGSIPAGRIEDPPVVNPIGALKSLFDESRPMFGSAHQFAKAMSEACCVSEPAGLFWFPWRTISQELRGSYCLGARAIW